jgi:hypothetical protein
MPKCRVFLTSVKHATCPDPFMFLDIMIMSCSLLLCNVRRNGKNSAVYVIFIREFYKLRVFGPLTGGQREVHNEEIHDLNLLPSTVKVM